MFPSSRRFARAWCLAALAWAAFVCWEYYAQLRRPQEPGVPLILPLWQGRFVLPHAAIAAARAGQALLGAVLAMAGALAAGLLMLRGMKWRPSTWAESLPVAIGLGTAAFGAIGLSFAGYGIYRPPVLRAAV